MRKPHSQRRPTIAQLLTQIDGLKQQCIFHASFVELIFSRWLSSDFFKYYCILILTQNGHPLYRI